MGSASIAIGTMIVGLLCAAIGQMVYELSVLRWGRKHSRELYIVLGFFIIGTFGSATYIAEIL